MNATCPGCGVYGSIELFLSDDARKIMHTLAVMPSDCGLVVFRYIRLFALEKNKKISKAKAIRLLQEVGEIIEKGGDYRRKHIVGPSHIWAQAMTTTCESLNEKISNGNEYKPLKNHNYLLQVASSLMNVRSVPQPQRAQSDLQHVRGFVQPAKEKKPMLQAIPDDETSLWLEKAKKDLIENIGMDEKTLLPVLIAHRAMELYNYNKELSNEQNS